VTFPPSRICGLDPTRMEDLRRKACRGPPEVASAPEHPRTGEMNVSAVADDRNRAHVHLTAQGHFSPPAAGFLFDPRKSWLSVATHRAAGSTWLPDGPAPA
jgi:hypothetical protein